MSIEPTLSPRYEIISRGITPVARTLRSSGVDDIVTRVREALRVCPINLSKSLQAEVTCSLSVLCISAAWVKMKPKRHIKEEKETAKCRRGHAACQGNQPNLSGKRRWCRAQSRGMAPRRTTFSPQLAAIGRARRTSLNVRESIIHPHEPQIAARTILASDYDTSRTHLVSTIGSKYVSQRTKLQSEREHVEP